MSEERDRSDSVMEVLNRRAKNLTDSELETVLNKLPTEASYRVLYLDGNQLSHWPQLANYPQFSAVTELWLAYNKLCEIDANYLPAQLVELYVQKNEITEICDLTHLHNLRVLWLSYNKLSSLPGHKLPACVERVDVSDNHISEVDDYSHLTQLTHMDLRGNHIKSIHPSNTQFRYWPLSHLSEEFFHSPEGYQALVEGGFDTDWRDWLGRLQQPPREVFKRGYESILSYFKAIRLSKKVKQSRKRSVFTNVFTCQ